MLGSQEGHLLAENDPTHLRDQVVKMDGGNTDIEWFRFLRRHPLEKREMTETGWKQAI